MSRLHSHKAMKGVRLNSRDYGSINVGKEQNEALRQLAIDVFTDCANRQMDFADCLTTILMTGLHFAIEAQNKAT